MSATPRKWNIAMLSSVSALEWARKPCWSLSETLLLLRGYVPEGENTSDVLPSMGNVVGKESDMLNRGILAGQLKPIGKDDNGEAVFAPSDVIAVAERHQFDAWRFWRGALDHANELNREQAGKQEIPPLAAPPAEQKPEPVSPPVPPEDDEDVRKGATAKEIAEAFPFEWKDKLSKCTSGSYKWLAETWIRKGKRKAGDATIFNPVAIAIALVTKQYKNKSECSAIIKNHFPDWVTDWEDKAEWLT